MTPLSRATRCTALLLALALSQPVQAQQSPASNTIESAPSDALPQVVPVAPGEQPLLNPAPAPEAAPVDSAGTSPVTNVSAPVVIPASTPGEAPMLLSPKRVQLGCSLRDYGAPVERGQMATAVINTCSGFSLHKPTFIMPLTYSPRFPGRESELVFQLSAKIQLWDFGPGAMYFGYTQKSFFQIYNTNESKPFRENNFNPELFARLPSPFTSLPRVSFDVGLEHESNGQDLPDSRSYNRIYVQPNWVNGRQVVQLKLWYRLPEEEDRVATDPKRDDNPDIGSYYGYGELHYRRDFPWKSSLIDIMLRANQGTGRGAVQADYSFEIGPVGALFVRAFHGYGESLIDYNRSITRVGVGIALHR